MVTFFSIVLTLLVLNAVLLLVSVNRNTSKEKSSPKIITRTTATEMYSPDFILPKYKKAV